ncbi:uncharacterized protein C8orf58 homolog isoform X2 [Oenanthe melanoleuca]|uniref:uncharacterized protein C8orf58 homolog isoform X2 n=1 Tax=Oenanthe melanoleuca TaxID=2939378 RepID=UPI0024C12E52|nr:uncharacterized protein C8orf58 homolog isoform X2 [Oenanthe melanoleuca]
MLRRRGAFAVQPLRADLDGPWESAESCIVRTSASVYRRLQESPRQPPRAMSARAAPQPPCSPPAGGRLLKSESEDSGVEMASNEHSPSTPLGSESSFSLDGLAAEEPPGGGEEPPRAARSRSGSRRPPQAAQRSRRQRCPRQLGRRSASAADLAQPGEPEGAAAGGARSPRSPRDPRAAPEVSGQGLRYLEHVCQMLERLARLQQDNRALRQQAGARGARPATLPSRQPPRQDLGTWRGERFRPRSCSDSQAPAAEPGPCRRIWGHSLSSPSLLDPCEGGAGVPPADKDGRSHWGRVKVLLTRLTRRSLRGGRCR